MILVVALCLFPVMPLTPAADGAGLPIHFERSIEQAADPIAACFGPGALYTLLEPAHHRIRVVDRAGTTVRTWGSKGNGPSNFLRPQTLVSDGLSLFVADSGNHRIQAFALDGRFDGSWGKRGSGPGQFLDPRGLGLDRRRLYVADTGNHRIQVFRRDGSFLFQCGSHGSGDGQLIAPHGVDADSRGHIFVSDTGNHRIVEFDAQGHHVGHWGDRGSALGFVSRPLGLVVRDDQVFVVDSENHRIQVFTPDGAVAGHWGLHVLRPHEGAGHLHYPSHLAFGEQGRALICEPIENRIQIFGLAPRDGEEVETLPYPTGRSSHFGRYCTTRGSLFAVTQDESSAVLLYDVRKLEPLLIHQFGDYGDGASRLVSPAGIELASNQRMFVCDPWSRRLLRYEHSFDPSQKVRYQSRLTRFVDAVDFEALRKGLPEPLASMPPLEPHVVHVGPDGHLYLIDPRLDLILVLDSDYHYVRHFGVSGDGLGQLHWPTDLSFARDGHTMFVVDQGNGRVQVFNLAGVPLYRFGHGATGPGQLTSPVSIASGHDGFVYVTDGATHLVNKYDETGAFVASWGGDGDGRPQDRWQQDRLFKPAGIAQTADRSRVVVLDYGNHRGQISFTQNSADNRKVHLFGSRAYLPAATLEGASSTNTGNKVEE